MIRTASNWKLNCGRPCCHLCAIRHALNPQLTPTLFSPPPPPRHLSLLAGRARALGAVQELRAENAELRQLLSTYLVSDVGAALKVPPTALL